MKLRLFIVSFAFCALLWGCHNSDVEAPALPLSPLHDTLANIDSLSVPYPDSALNRMYAFFDTYAGQIYTEPMAFDRNYANFLLNSLQLDEFYRQSFLVEDKSNLDTIIAVADYFDSIAQKFSGNADLALLRAQTHVLIGRKTIYLSLIDSADVVVSCRHLLEAAEIMENQFSEDELLGSQSKLYCQILNHMAFTYTSKSISEPAIHFYKKTSAVYKKRPMPDSQYASILHLIGYEYYAIDQFDSAFYYYDEALKCVPETDTKLYHLLTTSKASVSYMLSHNANSSLDILYSIKNQCDFMNLTEVNKAIGYIYYEEKQYDSALAYTAPMFEIFIQSGSIEKAELAVAQRLHTIYEALGETEKAQEMASFLSTHGMKSYREAATKKALTDLYLDYLQRQEDRRLQMERQEARQQRNKTLVFIAIFIVLAALAAWLLHRRKMQAEQEAHRMEKASMSGRLKRSNEELRELKGQIRQQNNAAPKPETQAASFAEEPICRLIMERVNEGQFKSKVNYLDYKEYALSKEQITALREAVDRHFGQFTIRLSKAYPDLTKSDLSYCCLYLLDLNDADIAALMQRAYNTVSDRSRKLKTLFGSEEPLSTILRGFAAEEQFL